MRRLLNLKKKKHSSPKLLKHMTVIQRVNLKIHLKNVPEYLLVFSVLGLSAWIWNKYLEAIIFAICFCVLRHKFTNILHYKTSQCMLFTNAMIIVSIPIVLPLTSSLFGGLISGFAVNYFANLIASNIFREQEKQELERLRSNKYCRDVYSMSEAQLRSYCKEYSLDAIDEEIVIQRLIFHIKGQELYSKIGYSKPQIIRKEKRIEAKLNIKLKDR